MECVVVGGGIAGLLLALALKKHGWQPTVVEQAPAYDEEVGGAIGLYPNGLRVIRDIDPRLLKRIRSYGIPYVYRRWTRHDGSPIAVGQESKLFSPYEEELSSLGIRRWKLQKALVDACLEAEIPLRLGVRLETLTQTPDAVHLTLSNGDTLSTEFVFGCDGVKSSVRTQLFGATDPKYTGITCLMGAANIPREAGICLMSSATSKLHGCYYPTGPNEQIFQIYFPTPEKPETWKPLSPEEGRKECEDLAQVLKKDGWSKSFIDPLLQAKSVLRVGLRAREPIPQWSKGRVVLLGDAAHPPVPYIGQGAMMAIEDVGVITELLNKHPHVDLRIFKQVTATFQHLRYNRTAEMLKRSQALGDTQLKRATSPNLWTTIMTEWPLKFAVWRHGTLPTMWFGSGYNYKEEVKKVKQAKL